MYEFIKEDKKLLGSRIERQLISYIQEEPIPVGEKIPNEFELAEKFGVGRSTIREAVKGLVSRGMLEVRRGSGTYVISTYPAEEDPLGLGRYDDKYQLALELFEVRLMIEPEIAAYAAKNASDEEIKELFELCDEVEKIYRSGENHVRKDIELHTMIAQCSKNRVVEILVPLIDSAVHTFANVTHRELMEETIETHRAIVNAIAAHDQVGARCAMVMHLTYNRQMIVRMLKEQNASSLQK
ncbi:MAG: FadR/GntR family transcriptional regulator [Lachnospiraceae bacterium]|nr:FadR/GntR family transcriptional regulator [Lachnospiraceae bacterium]